MTVYAHARLNAARNDPASAADAAPVLDAAAAVATAAALVPALQAEAAEVDQDGLPLESIALLHARGLLAAPLPRMGPALIDPRHRLQLLQVLAHIGRGSLPVGRLYEGHVNALTLMAAFGSAEQNARASAAAAAGALFAVWNTEAADGVRLLPGSGGAEVLHGHKVFASGAGLARRALVTARGGDGRPQMVLLDLEAQPPGIGRGFWQPLGMRPTASYEVDLGGIEVTSAGLVGEPGDYLREPCFSGGAVRFAAVQQGGVEAIFDAARAFLRGLNRIGDPYQRARMGEMAVLVASGRHWLQAAALNVGETGSGAAAQVAHANLMRTAIEGNALRVLELAARSVGARGLLRPAPFERIHRDLTHYLRQAGPDAALAAAGAWVLDRDDPAYALWSE